MAQIKSRHELMTMALEAAALSPDPSTQNGAILATQDGRVLHHTRASNEFPRGVRYMEERWERPLKYEFVEHAERNAIYAAARYGVATEGLVLYVVWAACSDCARGIIQSGISEVISLPADAHGHWGPTISTAATMLDEAGVKFTYLDGADFAHAPDLRRDGKPWKPC